MSHREDHGFSLIEVILAMALLAAVLISIASLFVFGEQQVKSGRTASEALAVARTILEEMEDWGFHQTYLQFGYDGSAATYTVDTRTNSYAAKWQSVLDAKLRDARALIDIDSLAPGGGTPNLSATRAIRMTVTVSWVEGQRARSIELCGVKL